MATYLQGVTDTGLEPIGVSPNFPYMMNALQKATALYDANFNKIAAGYSNILNADITNTERGKLREEYLNKAKEQIKNLAGADLSIQANVEQADKVYAPFWEDKGMLTDISWTKQQNNELGKQQAMMNSNDPKERELYSNIPTDLINYNKNKVKNADVNDLSIYNTPIVKSTPFYNQGKEFVEWLKENDYDIESVRNGDGYITTVKNGPETVGTYYDLFKTFAGNKYDQQNLMTGQYQTVQGINAIKNEYKRTSGQDIDDKQALTMLPQFYKDQTVSTLKHANTNITEKLALYKTQMETALAADDMDAAQVIANNVKLLKSTYKENEDHINAYNDPNSEEYQNIIKGINNDPNTYFGRIYQDAEAMRAARAAANKQKLEIKKDDSYWQAKQLQQNWAIHTDQMARKDAEIQQAYDLAANKATSKKTLGTGKSSIDTDNDGTPDALENITPQVNVSKISYSLEDPFNKFESMMMNAKNDALASSYNTFTTSSPAMEKIMYSQQAEAIYDAIKTGNYNSSNYKAAFNTIKETLKKQGVDVSKINGPYALMNAATNKYLTDAANIIDLASKPENAGNKDLQIQAQGELKKYVDLKKAQDELNNVYANEESYKKEISNNLGKKQFENTKTSLFRYKSGNEYKVITAPNLMRDFKINNETASAILEGKVEVKEGLSPEAAKDFAEYKQTYDVSPAEATEWYNANKGYTYLVRENGKTHDVTAVVSKLNGISNGYEHNVNLMTGLKDRIKNGKDVLSKTLNFPNQQYYKDIAGQQGVTLTYTAVENKPDVADNIARDAFTGQKLEIIDDKRTIVNATSSDQQDAANALIDLISGNPTTNLATVNLYPISPKDQSKRAIGLKYDLTKFTKEQLKNIDVANLPQGGEIIVQLNGDAEVANFPRLTDKGFYNLLLSTNTDINKPPLVQDPVEEKAGLKYAMYKRQDGKIMYNVGVKVAIPNNDKTSVSYRWMDATDTKKEYNPKVFSEMPNTVSIDEFIPNIRATSVTNIATNFQIASSVAPPKDVTTTISSDKKDQFRKVFE